MGENCFSLKKLNSKVDQDLCSKVVLLLLKFVLYLYCSKNLLSMVVNREKLKSFIAEDITQRLPQLTATVDGQLTGGGQALGLDLIHWSLTATADWFSAVCLRPLCCI